MGCEDKVPFDGEIPIGPFRCPLRGDCLSVRHPLFGSPAEVNEAVLRYQARKSPRERASAANEIFQRHLPLVRKALSRCCGARLCFSGGCPVEDLVGEAYASFRSALDDYEADRGVDFLGFVSQRLHWDLRHRNRHRIGPPGPTLEYDSASATSVENHLLDGVLVGELLAQLNVDEAELIRQRYGLGYSCEEVAAEMGLSHAAVRKRLQRVRTKLRSLNQPAEA